MRKLLRYIFDNTTPTQIQISLCFMRVTIGIISVKHGLTFMLDGMAAWQTFGAAINVLGIYFWPTMWGFLAACTKFFGSIMFTFGFATRIVSFLIAFMMFIATLWHIQKGESFIVYAYPLSLVLVFLFFASIGGGRFSIDYYLTTDK